MISTIDIIIIAIGYLAGFVAGFLKGLSSGKDKFWKMPGSSWGARK